MRPALLCLLLAGCTTIWIKPGAGQSDFSIDDGQCSAQAYSAGAGAAPRILIYSSCMRGKGWEKQR